MAKTTDLYLTKAIKAAAATLTSADTTAWKTLYTAGTDDAIVKALSAVSDDTAAINLRLGIDPDGTGTTYQIGTVNVPIASGTNGAAPAVDLLAAAALPGLSYDRHGKPVLLLPGGALLRIAALATMTADKTLTVLAQVEEY